MIYQRKDVEWSLHMLFLRKNGSSSHLGKRYLITDNRYNHLILKGDHSRQQVPDVATFKSYQKVTIHKKRAFVRPFF